MRGRVLARAGWWLAILAALGGCDSPEATRLRGGGTGGDGGNYVRDHVAPPSKIDASKDLRRIDHYGPAR
jgi:hypothetical protein